MELRFWGVRGSAAVPGLSTLEFGGNTSCMELVGSDAGVVLFDGGTGIRAAGLDLMGREGGPPSEVHLFLTHFHLDHIQGIPFFAPLYSPNCRVKIYASGFGAPLNEALHGLMSSPYFPVPFSALPAVELIELGASGVKLGSVLARPFEVNHPQGACAYSIETGTVRAIYAPDREHGDPRLDPLFLNEARGATVLVVDSQYTPEEYETHRGWGHSTWVESARDAREAGVTSLVLFHHDPGHNDDILHRIEKDAQREFPDTFVAKEGWAFEL
jgi:phosphoribosyl 1,2-cyclic phosphodiesterase